MNAIQLTTAVTPGNANATVSAAGGQAGTTPGFAAALTMVLSGQNGTANSQQGNGNLLPFLTAGALPEQLVSMLDGQANLDIEGLLEQLQAWLEQGSPEAAALLADPSILAWMKQASETLNMQIVLPDQSAATVEDGNVATDAKQAALQSLMQVIDRLLGNLRQGDQPISQGTPRFEQLVAELLPMIRNAVASVQTVDDRSANPNAAKMSELLATVSGTKPTGRADGAQERTSFGKKDSVKVDIANVTVLSQPKSDAQLLNKLGTQSLYTHAALTVNTEGTTENSATLTSNEAGTPQTLAANAAIPTDMAKSAQTAQLKQTVPTMQAQAFAEQFSQMVVKDMKIAQFPNFSEATIRLMPEHLGEVHIKLSMQSGQLTAQIVADTAMGRELLENQLPQLRSALQTQGIQVQKLEVNAFQPNGGFFQDAKQSSSGQQQQQRNRQGNLEGFDEEFGLSLETQDMLRQLRSGTSFEVSA